MIIGMGGLLLAAGPVFSATATPDPVAFTHSMELGDVRQAEQWLDAGMSPDYMGSRIGSGLMIGAWEGKIELMRLFISRGADIDLLNSNGESALAMAAWRGQMAAVKWLLERGARINAPSRKWSALHYAVFSGHAEVADYLIEQGADINAQSTNGSSVLMMAVYEGNQDLARKLIEKGADRTPKNDWGDGALEWAMRQNRLEIARMVSNPEEFNIAVAKPKESWGEPVRSLRTSKELENLLNIRETLIKRGYSTEAVDKRIAVERMRIVRSEMDKTVPGRAATMEITASRAKPQEQSTQIIYDDKGKAMGYKAPPATYFGTPKMPPKAPVRNY
ncbi:ankyrin repeat domain-containing protein [Dechloromonas sp. ARDL1]|uniref:ankyrin repeat domain-containing protein n=1 Tax=Dechloromonas sp. ARDL1 TaxID=3322121 RepID=UPI003DA6F014